MVIGLGFGLALVIAGAATSIILPRHPQLWKTIPRDRVIGIVLGAICLIWAVQLVSPLLEGGLARFRPFLYPLVAMLAVGAYFHLEYLMTRAIGGFLLLMTNHLMHVAFVIHAPIRPALSIVGYALGICGIFMISSPYHFRDLLEKSTHSPKWRTGFTAALVIAGIVLLAGFSMAGR